MTNDPPFIPSEGEHPTEFDGAGLPPEEWAQSDDAVAPGEVFSQGASPTNWADDQLRSLVEDGTDLPPEMLDEQKAVLLKPGDVVNDRFEVVKQLGFGGMGAVYHVKDRITGQDRALKVMLPSLLKNEEARQRFVDEVAISQELVHEGVVRVYDLGVDRARRIRFFTMEYIEGRTLHRLLRERGGKLPLKEALHIARQLCRVLEYAHRYTVHRDLKPQNIMIKDDGSIKVLDFGLAKLMSPGRLTKSSMALGTAYYQAPEQSVKLAKLDQRADLYSTGIILYQMLTGRIAIGRFKVPSELDPGIPKFLDAVVSTCIEPEPEDRYANAAMLLRKLDGTVGAYPRQGIAGMDPGQEVGLGGRPREDVSGKAGEGRSGELLAGVGGEPAFGGIELAEQAHGPNRGRLAAVVGAVIVLAVAVYTALRPPQQGVAPSPLERGPAAGAERKDSVGAERSKPVHGAPEPQPGDERTFAGIEMTWVLPSSFTMGSPPDEEWRDSDEIQHRVALTDGFWMGKREVTQAQWQAVMGGNPSHFRGTSLPVETVSWVDCQDFIRRLNAKNGEAFRLPTEAEWECACRADTHTKFSFGDSNSELGAYAWYLQNSGNETHPVGQKRPNGWGLYDMHGNVWEWCEDKYGAYPTGSVTNPTGPETRSLHRVYRGGCWRYSAASCRAANRAEGDQGGQSRYLGFRLARDADR